jgi:hypothetical protein
MAGTDYQGIALLIGAVGVAVPSIVTSFLSVISLARQKEIHDLVNGQSAKINAMSEAKGFVEGGNEERARPTAPK